MIEIIEDSASENHIEEKSSKAAVKKSKEPKVAESKKSMLKKLEPETAKLLNQLKDKANKKDHGRKVRDNEVIHLGLSLIESHHLDGLKESTYSEKDRLAMAHADYQKVHGKLTLDQFIGKLLKGEIAPNRQN